jgi:hypothetical protein
MARIEGLWAVNITSFYVDRMAELLHLHIRKSAFMLLEVNLIVLVMPSDP